MAFGLFRKRQPEAAEVVMIAENTAPSVAPQHPEPDTARDILELLELELGALIRQLERAATSVPGGAESPAPPLPAIRARPDVLADRSSAAQSTATTFAQAADKFTHS